MSRAFSPRRNNDKKRITKKKVSNVVAGLAAPRRRLTWSPSQPSPRVQSTIDETFATEVLPSGVTTVAVPQSSVP